MLSPPWKKRWTKKVLGPSELISSATLRLMPVIADAIAITTITPMATPRMVRKARTLLLRMESMAIPTPSKMRATFMAGPLFRPEGGDRVEPGCAAGGIGARDHPDGDAEEDAHRDRPGRDGRRHRGQRLHDPSEPQPGGDAERRADGRERGGLDDELGHDVPALRPERLAD